VHELTTAVSVFVVVVLLPRSVSFFCRENPPRRFFSIICNRPAHWRISAPSWMLLHNLCSVVHHSALGSSSGWFLQKLEIWHLLGTKLRTVTEQQLSAWKWKGYGSWTEFHFSWVYTFSVMLSFLQNWAIHDRYWLRPSTPTQLCWSSSRLQPLENYNLIKFATIRPWTLNHDRNVWNCREAPDETTCLTAFFRCPSALALICTKLFNVCAKNSLSL